MTFLPVVERELRSAARRRTTYWIRMGVAFVGLLIGGWIMLIPELRRPHIIGQVLFYSISILGFAYGLLVGLMATADSVSEEKREGTLGLLFLTDLKGYDIVLGKMAATSIHVVYGLVALFPILAIPLLAGGVTGAEFGRVVLVALNNLFFSLAVGLFCSSISRDERKAMVMTLVVITVFTVLLPVTGLIWYDKTRAFHLWCFIPSPGYACFFAFDEMRRGLPRFNQFNLSVICLHTISWALLLASCWIVPRTWQDRAASPAQLRRRSFLQRVRFGASDVRSALRTRLLEVNAFYWLAARERFKSVPIWNVFALSALLWIWGLSTHPRDWKNQESYFTTALLLHNILKIWLATEACRRFAADRKSGALELLLSTPISVREILRGQKLALAKQFGLPLMAMLLVDFVFLMAERRHSLWVLTCVVGMVVLVADMVTLSWLGMWQGINSHRANRAAAAAVVRILILPWVLVAMALTVFGLLDYARILAWNNWWEERGPILLYLFLSLGVDAYFGFSSRNRLLQEFRAVATERFEKKKSWFRRRRSDESLI